MTIRPAYQPAIVAWVRAGGRYMVANLRGGGEYGDDWHRAGMRDRKANVFADFAAVTDGLHRGGLCPPGGLAITGTSNGGLLVRVALTRAPEKYAAVACLVPLLDMANFDRSVSVTCGGTSTAIRGSPTSWPGCWRTRHTTTCGPGWTTRRCCSRRSPPTPGWTRCTPGR